MFIFFVRVCVYFLLVSTIKDVLSWVNGHGGLGFLDITNEYHDGYHVIFN